MEWDDSIKNSEDEKKRLEDLIKNNPYDANAYYELGVIYDYMRNFPEAVHYCKKAIEVDQGENQLYYAFLVYLYCEREFDEEKALDAAANLADLRPDEGDQFIIKAMDSLDVVCDEPAYAFITKLREQNRNFAAKILERWFYNP